MSTAIRIGFALLALLMLIAGASAQHPIDIERGLKNIYPDSTVVVAFDLDGKLAVFQKQAIARVSSNNVIFQKDAFVLLSVQPKPSPADVAASIAVRSTLMDLWEEWKKDRPAKEEFSEKREINGVAYTFTGRAVTVKDEVTIRLKEIVQSGRPRK